MKKYIITVVLIWMAYSAAASILPHQTISAPADKYDQVIEILKNTGYYQNTSIQSVTFTSTREVTAICEMPIGKTAIGCTQPSRLYARTFDIWISNEDLDWKNTLVHEIAHAGYRTEAEADAYMNEYASRHS